MLVLITGGSGSGKSEYAENWLVNHKKEDTTLYYLATMKPYGQEAKKRIQRHQLLRANKEFVTIEQYANINQVQLPKRGSLLLECMTNLVANEMFDEQKEGQELVQAVCGGIDHLLKQTEDLVIVTGELASDGMLYERQTQAYLSCLTSINEMIANRADLVVEVVYSYPNVLRSMRKVEV